MSSIPASPFQTAAIALFATVVSSALLPSAHGQGCMATRVSPPMLGASGSGQYLQPGETEVSVAFRHYEAERHFFDYNEERDPANAPRVERTTYDLSLTRMLSYRTGVTLSVPYQTGTFDRSPIPPYTGSADKASGLGDISLILRRWMFDPQNHSKYNVRLGIGAKFPTGDFDTQTDRLVNGAPAGSPPSLEWRRGPADMAIQPGDGGFGIILGAEGFYGFHSRALAYGEVTYLANPRGQNGVNNQWSGAGPYVPNNVTSVPDYFLARTGVSIAAPLGIDRASLQLGLRLEGQPVRDLIGSDDGFRRPGYSLSFEPGVAYSLGNGSIFLSVPVTVHRVRWKSVDENNAGRSSAVSAAFADYNILAGFTRRW